MTFPEQMASTFGVDRVRSGAPLAPFTTFKVGGPADWLFDARTSDELLRALDIARASQVPVTILGGGSNVLIGDKGVRGLVIRPRGASIELAAADQVQADAGVTINALVRWTIIHGLAGLEAWAGTPGTVGGGIYGNAHYGGRLIGDRILLVRLVDADGRVSDASPGEMEFGYDRSRLQRTREVVLWARFSVGRGEPADLRAVARQSLAHRKRTQPLASPSAGCVFQNPYADRDCIPVGIPASAGALVDRAGLKGRRQGKARISPTHANFIVNDGGATAADIRSLIDLCRREVRAQFGVELVEEVVYMGEY